MQNFDNVVHICYEQIRCTEATVSCLEQNYAIYELEEMGNLCLKV